MLVLSRQRDETIKIGDDIDITIVAIKGDRVRVGIAAPPDVPVHRKEVFDEIQSKRVTGAVSPRLAGRSSQPYPSPVFTGPQAEKMLRILDKQTRILENASKQEGSTEFVDRYRQLCEDMIALIQ